MIVTFTVRNYDEDPIKGSAITVWPNTSRLKVKHITTTWNGTIREYYSLGGIHRFHDSVKEGEGIEYKYLAHKSNWSNAGAWKEFSNFEDAYRFIGRWRDQKELIYYYLHEDGLTPNFFRLPFSSLREVLENRIGHGEFPDHVREIISEIQEVDIDDFRRYYEGYLYGLQ